jgi:hypothetical protein
MPAPAYGRLFGFRPLPSGLLNAAALSLLGYHPLLDKFTDFASQGRESGRFHMHGIEHKVPGFSNRLGRSGRLQRVRQQDVVEAMPHQPGPHLPSQRSKLSQLSLTFCYPVSLRHGIVCIATRFQKTYGGTD